MTQDDSESPKKRPMKKRAAKKTSGESKKNSTGSSKKDSSDAYRAKIQKALQANLDDFIKNRNLNQKQISTINSFVEEHLSCFVLLGYTVDGDPVSLVNSPTQKDSDSLGTLLQKFLNKYSEPPNPGMGMF